MRVFVSGTAGFIGFHLARRLLEAGHQVFGFDGFTPYYDVALKRARHAILERDPNFNSREGLLEDAAALKVAVADSAAEVVIHLAAQAGVRYSLENPASYVSSNLVGTGNLLEAARATPPRHLLIASTSSVYGVNDAPPFREDAVSDRPLTLYAATKKANEAMAHAYAHLFAVPTTCFRFFTVYGPWGRPDMALFKFVRAILADEPIEVYGGGDMRRDFTYVDDLVEAIVRLVDRPPVAGAPASPDDTLSPIAPHRVVNIGGGRPVGLLDFVEVVERALGRPARRALLPMQPGDVPSTCADPALLRALTGYLPETPLEDGVAAFVAWFRAHYGV